VKIDKLLFFFVIFTTILWTASRQAQASPPDAGVAFARLKTLVGEWSADSSHGKVHSSYELIAGGSVLVERISVAGEGEMLTTYHLDGEQLVLTHYCMAGNQPHMVAERYDAATGNLQFAFAGASNLKPGAGHMHAANIQLISQDRYDAKWDFVENDKVKFSEDLQYSRIK
jgi:hypothetical protein